MRPRCSRRAPEVAGSIDLKASCSCCAARMCSCTRAGCVVTMPAVVVLWGWLTRLCASFASALPAQLPTATRSSKVRKLVVGCLAATGCFECTSAASPACLLDAHTGPMLRSMHAWNWLHGTQNSRRAPMHTMLVAQQGHPPHASSAMLPPVPAASSKPPAPVPMPHSPPSGCPSPSAAAAPFSPCPCTVATSACPERE